MDNDFVGDDFCDFGLVDIVGDDVHIGAGLELGLFYSISHITLIYFFISNAFEEHCSTNDRTN